MRNSLFDRFCSALAISQCFDSIGHEHLCVGHTHEDVGPKLSSSKKWRISCSCCGTTSHFLIPEVCFSASKMRYLDWYPESSEKEMKMCPSLSTYSRFQLTTHGQESPLTFFSKAMPPGPSVASWMQSNMHDYTLYHYRCSLRIPTFLCWKNQTRFLNLKLTGHFKKRNMFFKATYLTTVRDWTGNLANYSTTAGAYRKRHKDEKEIPHSFTFLRRDCPLTALFLAVSPFLS